MKVLMVEPGAAPYEKELNGLHEMQAAVGGLIQAIYPFEDKVAVVCDDEGMLKPNEFNRSMPGGYGGVFGPFFVCGLGEDDFTSLTPQQMEVYKKQFHHAEILLGIKDNTPVTIRVEPFKSVMHPRENVPTRRSIEVNRHDGHGYSQDTL